MKIIFDSLGFASANVFVVKNGRQYDVGYIRDKFYQEWEFFYNSNLSTKYLSKEELPTPEEILTEYKKQFKEKGVFINKEIGYAG